MGRSMRGNGSMTFLTAKANSSRCIKSCLAHQLETRLGHFEPSRFEMMIPTHGKNSTPGDLARGMSTRDNGSMARPLQTPDGLMNWNLFAFCIFPNHRRKNMYVNIHIFMIFMAVATTGEMLKWKFTPCALFYGSGGMSGLWSWNSCCNQQSPVQDSVMVTTSH